MDSLRMKKITIKIGGIAMWIITLYSKNNIQMFEFSKEEEAREAFTNIKGSKILSHVVYFNDHVLN
jgi:hypothetical protein